MLHFSSRSIIVQFPKDPSQPLYKYLIKQFKKEPAFDKRHDKTNKGSLPMIIYASRVTEVPINSSAPKPYILHNAK